MKVIILKDIDKVGKKYQVKEISDGFARNFLFPKGLVKFANKENLKWLEARKKIEAEKAEEELKESGDLVSKIDGQEIEISVKVGDKGQFFEKIDKKDISKKLKEQGYNIDKNQIEFNEPIEELGEFPIKIKFDHNLEADIKVIVIEEVKNDKEPLIEK